MKKKRNNCRDECLKCKQAKLRAAETTEKHINFKDDICKEMLVVKIKREALYELIDKVGSRAAESGGILLGPIGTDCITDFYFDRGSSCTGSTYSPDHVALNQKMREEWKPAGLEFRGFAHSHPGNLDSLTSGDMSYIKKLMNNNSDMKTFVAPIVLPDQYAIRPLVVSRDKMDHAQQAFFEIFD